MNQKRKPYIFAVSGIKNSGKTTLIEKLLPLLREKGLKTAVIKHDGHDFEPDVPGTDSWRFAKAGAFGTAVFSKNRAMAVKNETTDERALAALFPKADLILLEGFKHSAFPKLEVVRKENGAESACRGYHLLAAATDAGAETAVTLFGESVQIFHLDDLSGIADFIYTLCMEDTQKKARICVHSKLFLTGETDFFGPGIYHLLMKIQETGSIQSAAAQMHMSYTKAWKLVNRAEKEIGFSFLDRVHGGKKGGSSTLTPEGERFMEAYAGMRKEMESINLYLQNKYFGGYQDSSF